MKKRIIISLALSAVLLFSTVCAVFADTPDVSTQRLNDEQATIDTQIKNIDMFSFALTPEEAKAALARQAEEEISELVSQDIQNNMLRAGPAPTYKYLYGPVVNKTAKGFAGNQLPGGYKFPSGGGFYWSDSGGPSVTVSVSFSAPFLPISFSSNLGNKAGSGQYANAPTKTDYYKLYVEKEYKVQPIIIYRNGEIWQRVTSTICYSGVGYAKKV